MLRGMNEAPLRWVRAPAGQGRCDIVSTHTTIGVVVSVVVFLTRDSPLSISPRATRWNGCEVLDHMGAMVAGPMHGIIAALLTRVQSGKVSDDIHDGRCPSAATFREGQQIDGVARSEYEQPLPSLRNSKIFGINLLRMKLISQLLGGVLDPLPVLPVAGAQQVGHVLEQEEPRLDDLDELEVLGDETCSCTPPSRLETGRREILAWWTTDHHVDTRKIVHPRGNRLRRHAGDQQFGVA